MKKSIAILVLTVLLSCEKEEQEKPPCVESPRSANTACITLYDPVCGCNGKTYGNSCEANAVGITTYTKGECK